MKKDKKDLEKQKKQKQREDQKAKEQKAKEQKNKKNTPKTDPEDFDDINKAITNEDIKLQVDTKHDLVDNHTVEKSSMMNSIRGLQHNQQQKIEEEVFDNLKGLDISYSSENSHDAGARRTNIKMNFGSNVMSKKDDQDSIHMDDSDIEGGKSKKSTANRHTQKETIKHERKPGGDDDEGDYV